MANLFLQLLNMSITAGWLVLAVIAFRFIFKKAPKWIVCAMWALVALRLIIPFSISSPLSVIPVNETIPTEAGFEISPQFTVESEYYGEPTDSVENEHIISKTVASVDFEQFIIFIASSIWGFGAASMLLYAVISYIRLRKRISNGVESCGIRFCSRIDTPFIFGIMHPIICVPDTVNSDDIDHIINHERAHIRRMDHLWKPLSFILLSAYWFNPIMWLSYILFCRDIETACDEKVLKEIGEENKKSYAQSLLNCSITRYSVVSYPLAFGEVGVKQRIKRVLNYKKPALWVLIVSAVICAVIAVAFMTDPKGKEQVTPDESTLPTVDVSQNETERIYTRKENGNLVSPSGEEYSFLGVEGPFVFFDLIELEGYKKGEERVTYHLTMEIPNCIYRFKNDEEKNLLAVTEGEFLCLYRKVSLPEFEFKPVDCSRIELVDAKTEFGVTNEHLTCGKGITDKAVIAEFLNDIYSQKTVEEAGLYDMVKDPASGKLLNCYIYAYIYVFYECEPSIGKCLNITSYNDLAYSVEIDGVEYVLPDEWLQRLENS